MRCDERVPALHRGNQQEHVDVGGVHGDTYRQAILQYNTYAKALARLLQKLLPSSFCSASADLTLS